MSLDTATTVGRSASDLHRHRFTLLVAAMTLLLLLAGGLVTSTGSGLAVPDWPLSFGTLFPPMVGGVLFEHGHRLVAAAVGLLTLILAVWYQWREARPWVRRLAVAALGAVVAQGILGGITVLLRLPVSISVVHACLAQVFFGLIVTLAVVSSPRFPNSPAKQRRASGPVAAPRFLGIVTTTLVFGQLILGAVMRHTGAGLAIPDVPLAFGRLIPPFASTEIIVHFAHRVGALVVATAVFTLLVRALRRHRNRPDLLRPALLAAVLVVVQIALGAAAILTRLAVLPTTVHLVVGAILMAACLVLTLRAWQPAGAWRESLALGRGAVTPA